MLKEGTKAIDFTLFDKEGKEVSLHDFLGQKIVLYFYPKDNTPGCTKQACGFKNEYAAYQELNTVVIGISKDCVKSHFNFASKYDLPFILLSDPNHQVIEAYEAWEEKKNYGRVYMGTSRVTYLIDEQGYILKTYPKVKVDTNALEIKEFLNTLK